VNHGTASLPEQDQIAARLRETVGPLIEAAYREQGKQDRSNRPDAAKASVAELFPDESARSHSSFSKTSKRGSCAAPSCAMAAASTT
jgi:aspartate carbamoyltransferase catalytic subunit